VLSLFEICVEVVLGSLVSLQIAVFTPIGAHPGEIQNRGQRLDYLPGRIKGPNEWYLSLRDYRRLLHVQEFLAGSSDWVGEIGSVQVFNGDILVMPLSPGNDVLSNLRMLRLGLDEETFRDEETHGSDSRRILGDPSRRTDHNKDSYDCNQ
jgi:hypothetical protein